jgi:methyltransferase family protein
VLRPALVRQAALDAELFGQLAAQEQRILKLEEASGFKFGQLAAQEQRIEKLEEASSVTAEPRDLGDLQYRVDLLERQHELAQAQALLPGVRMPADGERVSVVAHDWTPGEERRVLCSKGSGPFASLLEVAALGLEKYARRHRWDLVLSREDLSEGRPAPWGKLRLAQDLLHDYAVVAWIDCDAVIVDFEHDLGVVLEDGKDFYAVELEGGTPRDCLMNTGVFVLRASSWTDRFLAEVWAQTDLIDHRWWENAAIMRVLGYEIDASPVVRGDGNPWMARVKLIDLAWNSIAHWARSSRPRINHYAALSVHRRRLLMLDDVTRTIVLRRSSDPLEGVETREDLPLLFNRLGLDGLGVEVGVQTGAYSAWILHRWAGARLISIDPWAVDQPDVYLDIANVEQRRHDNLFASTTNRLVWFGERSTILRMTGEQAASQLGDGSLDFVYLDARHDEASVARDLAIWTPKVRPDGVMAGHDYLDGELAAGRFGVKTAVDRFFGARGLEVHETRADRPWSSWWVIVPSS